MAFQYSVNMPPEARFYLSHERIYVDATGKVCAEDSPAVASLLVGEGGQIPWEQAVAAGLVHAEDAPLEVTTADSSTAVVVPDEHPDEPIETPAPRRAGRPAKAKSEGE